MDLWLLHSHCRSSCETRDSRGVHLDPATTSVRGENTLQSLPTLIFQSLLWRPFWLGATASLGLYYFHVGDGVERSSLHGEALLGARYTFGGLR